MPSGSSPPAPGTLTEPATARAEVDAPTTAHRRAVGTWADVCSAPDLGPEVDLQLRGRLRARGRLDGDDRPTRRSRAKRRRHRRRVCAHTTGVWSTVPLPSSPLAAPDPRPVDKVVNLCKRRGFVFPSAEIYGGFRSTYDYGPLGVLLLRNVKDAWWRSMVQLRDDVVGLDAAILGPPASGRRPATSPTSPTRSSTAATARSGSGSTSSTTPTPARAAASTAPSPRPASSTSCSRPTPARWRAPAPRSTCGPETAQGMFVNFKNVLETSRKKPPFGIAQVGKSFRNEITPGNFVFRTREFEQMEMEYFVPPDEAPAWYEYWCQRAAGLVRRPRDPRGAAPAPAPRRRRAEPLLRGHLRRRVPVPVGLGRARGHRQPPTTTSPSTPSTRASGSSTSTRPPTSATCPT